MLPAALITGMLTGLEMANKPNLGSRGLDHPVSMGLERRSAKTCLVANPKSETRKPKQIQNSDTFENKREERNASPGFSRNWRTCFDTALRMSGDFLFLLRGPNKISMQKPLPRPSLAQASWILTVLVPTLAASILGAMADEIPVAKFTDIT